MVGKFEQAHRSTNKPRVTPGAASQTGVAELVDGHAGRCRGRWYVAGLCQQPLESPKEGRWWGWRPAKNDVAHGGVARRLGLLLPRPVSVRTAHGGIPEL